MTILAVVKEAATALGLEVPSLVFGNTAREWIEMQAVIAEVAEDIAAAHDWQKLLIKTTITGDGTAEAFAMPTTFKRMQKTASLWSSRWSWEIEHIVDPDQWLEMQTVPFVNVTGQWIVYGDELHVLPVMANDETVMFFHVSKDIVVADGGALKDAFSDDKDTFRLSERLLKLGIIAKWKQNKGQAYEQAFDDFEVLKLKEIDRDGGSKPILTGRQPRNWRKGRTWPGNVTGAP